MYSVNSAVLFFLGQDLFEGKIKQVITGDNPLYIVESKEGCTLPLGESQLFPLREYQA